MKKIEDQDAEGVILVAEDNENDAFILRRAAEKAHLHVRLQFVPDGQSAMDYLGGFGPYQNRKLFPTPDVVLLDLKLPFFDGMDVLAFLRNTPESHDLPTVVLTDSSLPKDQRMATQLGANGYYLKDSDPRETQRMLFEICRKYLHPMHAGRRL